MNILTDEEIKSTLDKISCCLEDVDIAYSRAIEAAVLSKLAEQDVEPFSYAYRYNSPFGGTVISYTRSTADAIEAIPLYTETQLLAAQQRTAEALIEPMAKVIYRQWWCMPEYTAWVDGGNSFKQDDARRIARNVVEREDWREYL